MICAMKTIYVFVNMYVPRICISEMVILRTIFNEINVAEN